MKPNKASNVIAYILGMAFNLAILALVAFGIYWFANWGFNRGSDFATDMLAAGPDYEIIFVLEEDTPRAEAAQLLYNVGAINNPWLFRLEMFLKNSTRVFRAGTYTLNANMSNTQVNATLRAGQTAAAAGHEEIRVREGWTIGNMAEYFEYRGFFSAEEFINYTQTGDFSNFRFLRDVPDYPERRRLEGYLFPDQYHIPLNPTPRDIIIRMLNRFEYLLEGAWLYRAEELGFTLDEIIIMASIIEGETGRPIEERAKISQVIHHRLRDGWPLQMDATARYAWALIGVDLYRVFHEHLAIESAYNTQTRLGLPIGPIGNPSLASIEGALNPSNTNYMFFVVDYSDHSRHVFNVSLADHNAAAARYHATLD
ncbi:MAG: endolytic transglycosylase MltG [Defluviitaleaceae bacterium]|nr:endolytic transglycosylase MltG [Defluviitaleaceae bacterium]